MRLDCKFTEQIITDFDRLWRCKQEGETLEISTPYKMPDSSLFTVTLTERGERLIACDGGQIWDVVREYPDLDAADTLDELRSLARAHGMKEGAAEGGTPLFFKDCNDQKILTSIIFDVITFSTLAANALTALLPEGAKEETTEEKRFVTQANDFIRSLLRSDQSLTTNHEFPGVPDVRFSSVIQSTSGVTVVSCISGSHLTPFRKNISDAADSFGELWESPVGRSGRLKHTIPYLNSDSRGYQLRKLEHRLAKLKKEAHDQSPISSAEPYLLERLIRAS